MAEITVTYDGTSLDTSTSLLERRVDKAPVFDPLAFADEDEDFPGHGKWLAYRTPSPRKFSFEVVSQIKNQTTIQDILRHAKAEVQDLANIIAGSGNTVKVEFSTYGSDDVAYSRFLWGTPDVIPSWNWAPKGDKDGIRNSGIIRNNIVCTARYPWFVNGTACYEETKSDGSTHAVTNGGDLWTGFRLEIDSPSTWDHTTVRISNTVDSADKIELYWADETMTDGDIVEYWFPNAALGTPMGLHSFRPNVTYGYERGVVAIASAGFFTIPTGSTTYTIEGIGGTGGTCNFKFTVFERYRNL